MLGLRWTLGVVTTVVVGAWVALVVLGGAFRRSFGASGNPPWLIALPVVVGALVLAALLRPERRALLHAAAALMLPLTGGALLLARASPAVATLGIAYAAAWWAFYHRVLRP
jgi:hypothetical protein